MRLMVDVPSRASFQVLSLSLEGNLKPKYHYLVNDLKNEVKSLTKYPMYLSLSLES
jgi:mTERF domain-containing protein, mitochondrial